MRRRITFIVIFVGFMTELLATGLANAQDRGLTVSQMQKEKRIALVIGNGAYDTAPLRNAVNDAAAMSIALEQRGFTVSTKIDVDYRQLKESVREFGTRIRGGGVGLFYYAGHGIQVGGRNYLVPIGADVSKESEVEYGCVDAGFILAQMEDAGNRLNIIILDACRNNPFGRGFRSGSKGLARMDAPSGSLLAYATAPGSVAADGEGENGLYTEALLDAMRLPGLKVEEVFKRVRGDVIQKSGNTQIPWESTSLTGDFFFTLTEHVGGALPEASAIALPTPDSTVAFDEIEKRRQKRITAEKQWSDCQTARQNDFARVKEYDKDRYLTAEEKTSAWQVFLRVVATDNPNSTEDDEMRQYARQRIDYWQQLRPTPVTTPKTTVPVPIASSGGMIDNGDDTVTDTKTGLMWAKEDSWNGTGQCINWNDAKIYISRLTTNGYIDWRLPTIDELKSILVFDPGKVSFHLNPVFASSDGYLYWSSEEDGSCCARVVNSTTNSAFGNKRDTCYYSSVRAVRRP